MTAVYSALDAVSAAIYATLNVSGLTDLATGGVGDSISQGVAFPYVLYEVQESTVGGLGSRPGSGKRTSEVEIRVHVFSQYEGLFEAQQIMAKVIELMGAAAPAVTGFGSWAIFHDETIPLGDQLIAGQRVQELVSMWRLYVSEGA